MGVIEFDDTMLVNIKHIDEQHKKLIDIFKQIKRCNESWIWKRSVRGGAY